MKGSLAKLLCALLVLTGGAPQGLAQNPADSPARPSDVSPQAAQEVPSGATAAPTPLGTTLPTVNETASLVIEPVDVAALPNVSPESIGTQKQDGLGAEMWKGTPRAVAERLLSSALPSSSPVLNNLMLRLLMTAATPPEGETDSPQKLTSKRVEKLVLFGDADGAWSLTKQAEAKLIDAATYNLVAESALINGDGSLCNKASETVKTHAGADWQKFLIVCRVRAKDMQATQVAIDVLRSESDHDSVFVSVADRNILSNGKSLPFQLTPLSPMTIALLQQANLPLPGSLFARADFMNISALLRLPAQQDVARLALAERAAERGLIEMAELGVIYRAISFPPDVLASPLASSESGLRLRALLFRVLEEQQKEPETKIAFTIKFAQSATPSFLNGAGAIIAAMLGDIKPAPTLAKDATILARLYMLSGKGELAQAWFAQAQSGAWTGDMQVLWPQFALAGFEAEGSYITDFGKWFDGATRGADDQTLRNVVVPTLLYLEAAGLKIPESAWAKMMMLPYTEKKFSYSPLLLKRMHVAALEQRRAETVLLAVSLAGEGEVSLPVMLGITAALNQVGFKNESSIFARQAVALLTKDN